MLKDLQDTKLKKNNNKPTKQADYTCNKKP